MVFLIYLRPHASPNNRESGLKINADGIFTHLNPQYGLLPDCFASGAHYISQPSMKVDSVFQTEFGFYTL
jgi:hypothetical protein